MQWRRITNHFTHHFSPLSYYVWKLRGKPGDSFVFRTKRLGKIKVPCRLLNTYKECFFDNTYLKGFPDAFSPKTWVDVGANVGYCSLATLNLYPNCQILAIEPMPNNLELLQQYINQAPIAKTQIQVFPMALAAKQGRLKLHFDPQDSFTTAASCLTSTSQSGTLEVPAQSLPQLLHNASWEQVDLVKLDCEGAEYQILESLPDTLWPKITRWAIETHHTTNPNHSLPKLVQLLQSKGYVCRSQGSKIWAWR